GGGPRGILRAVNAIAEHPRGASRPRSAAMAARNAFLRGTPDPPGADAGDAVATHLLELGKLVASKDLRTFPALAAALERARPHLDEAGELARMHVGAADAWLAHRPLLAGHL